MTTKEAIYTIERLAHTEAKWPGTEDTLAALDLALTALRHVSREQARRGEWEKIGADYRGQGGIWRCTECRKTYPYKCDFCPNCGTPMTDEAVQMVMERLEELKNEIG